MLGKSPVQTNQALSYVTAAPLGNGTSRFQPFSSTVVIENSSRCMSSTTSSTSLQAGKNFWKVGKWHPLKWHEGTEIYALQSPLPLSGKKHGECKIWGWILLLPFQCLCPKHLKNEFAFSNRFPSSVVQKVPPLSNPLESNQLSSVLPQLLIKNFLRFVAWRTKTSNRQHLANVDPWMCQPDNLQSNTWKQFINQEIRGLLMMQGCLKIQIPKNDLVNGDFFKEFEPKRF